MRLSAACLLCAVPVAQVAAAQDSAAEERERFHAFLQEYGRAQGWDEAEAAFKASFQDDDSPYRYREARYAPVFLDLDGDGRNEAIVRLSGGFWCGATGGCRTYVFTPQGDSYRLVSSFFGWLPIRVLPSETNGWRDFSVWFHNGAANGYVAVLPFDGKSYPDYPASPPAWRAEDPEAGEIVISNDSETAPLFD